MEDAVSGFNWIDYIIIGVIAFSTVISLIRGFAREAMSLVSWVLAIWVGLRFSDDMASVLPSFISHPTLRISIGFGLLFVITLLVGALMSYIVGHLVEKTGLSGMNRILGVVLGVGRGVLFIAVVLLLAGLTTAPETDAWNNSVLVGDFGGMTSWLQTLLPDYVSEQIDTIKEGNIKEGTAEMGKQIQSASLDSGS